MTSSTTLTGALVARKSTTTCFDMLRIGNGKIAEHRDCAPEP